MSVTISLVEGSCALCKAGLHHLKLLFKEAYLFYMSPMLRVGLFSVASPIKWCVSFCESMLVKLEANNTSCL